VQRQLYENTGSLTRSYPIGKSFDFSIKQPPKPIYTSLLPRRRRNGGPRRISAVAFSKEVSVGEFGGKWEIVAFSKEVSTGENSVVNAK
jgi:hypothetical protein